jgi:hypothetical protein
MILAKDELLSALQNEVQILLHLISKTDSVSLGYRPSEKQRSTLELLQYLAMMAPTHFHAVMAPAFDIGEWRSTFGTQQALAKTMNLAQVTEAIASHSEMFDSILGAVPDTVLNAGIEMFGRTASRASMLISLVLNHYVAYRMQLFLYLKASGRAELSTMNLWVGRDTF